jgi:alkylation response protein AidB-like acyl-CoA dehydrogenase
MDDETEAPWGGRRFNPTNKDAKLWLDRMAAKGWTAPMWPKEYGGGGLTREQNKVLRPSCAASRPARR